MPIALGKPAGYMDRIVERRARLIRQIPGFCGRDLSVVDVGCGNGATLSLLAGEFKNALGVDIVPDYESLFMARMQHVGLSNAAFRLANIDAGWTGETFDRLICFEVIEHLQTEGSASRLRDMLKPGGVGVISVPNKWWIFETHGANLPLLPWNRVPFFSWLPGPVHERWARARIYTPSRIRRLLARAGLTILDLKFITAPLDVLGEGALQRLLTGTIFRNDTTRCPLLATSIFVHVRRDP